MGERGPAPRREDERRRRNKPERPPQKVTQDVLNSLPFEVDYHPEPPDIEQLDPDGDRWHPIVQNFYDDLQSDPARKWMTSADWAAVAIFCESMSRELGQQVIGTVKETGELIMGKQPPKSATMTAFLKMLEHIGVTESARLRLAKEVTLFPPAPPPMDTEGNVIPMTERRRDDVQ